MTAIKVFGFLLVSFVWIGIAACSTTTQQTASPNIIYIFADDLGYGELGIYGQKKN